MPVSDEERWLQIGLLAGLDGRGLPPLLASMCGPYDNEIRAAKESLREGMEAPRLSHQDFTQLQGLVDDEKKIWSSLLELFESARIPADRLRDHSDGAWVVVAGVGLALPVTLVGLQRQDWSGALSWPIVMILAIAAIVRWGAAHVVPSRMLSVFARANATLGVMTGLIAIAAFVAPVLPDPWLLTALASSASVSGFTLAARAVRRALREPVYSDLRRQLEQTRDSSGRIEEEWRRRTEGFLQTGNTLQETILTAMHQKQLMQRTVTEGYHLGAGLTDYRRSVEEALDSITVGASKED